MANNDMEVIMYKILRYLYDCMKEGKSPREEDLCCKSRLLGDIPQTYWNSVMRELSSHKYIRGLLVLETKDKTLIDASEVSITFEGVEFLKENSRMQEAKAFVGKAFETVLAAIVSALV